MTSPVSAIPPAVPPPPSVAAFPAPPSASQAVPPPVPNSPGGEDVFFGADEKNATGTNTAPGAGCTSVENTASVENIASVVQNTPVKDLTPVELSTPVEHTATVKENIPNKIEPQSTVSPRSSRSLADYGATVASSLPVAKTPTGKVLASTKDHRLPRARPIVRITDGLTPGQYAVYSLMYEAGKAPAGRRESIGAGTPTWDG